MKEDNKHRGGIWSTESFGQSFVTINSTEKDYDGMYRSILSIKHTDADHRQINEANAAFIVKACNSHYALMEALRTCMTYLPALMSHQKKRKNLI